MDTDGSQRDLLESILSTGLQQQGPVQVAYYCSLELHHLAHV